MLLSLDAAGSALAVMLMGVFLDPVHSFQRENRRGKSLGKDPDIRLVSQALSPKTQKNAANNDKTDIRLFSSDTIN